MLTLVLNLNFFSMETARGTLCSTARLAPGGTTSSSLAPGSHIPCDFDPSSEITSVTQQWGRGDVSAGKIGPRARLALP